ncbi:MAG: GTPase HflX [Rhizobiaceae bacterium]|nr:GTPase HflX [Rhizobiaceae bacterium]
MFVPNFPAHVQRSLAAVGTTPNLRTPEARLQEAIGLAKAIGLNIIEASNVPVRTIRPSTLFGKGKVEELGKLIEDQEIGLAIIDHAITPVQQQSLEEAWNCKVLDRTGLILEIFGERAQTKEGRLQVELAHLNYQKSRLVRAWTHLERQRGGLGFVGGPGETQIEADRRMIQLRVNNLEKDLEKVRRTRLLHRAKRKKIPHPVVALVGYTNAGKSTLFNMLTGAGVVAKDLLFATLDPTMRQLNLPGGTKVILSDTVGFISNLPTHLVAAFRATLEEVVEADLILHVRDIADPDTAAQAKDVMTIMGQLGLDDGESQDRIMEIWNKIDLLDPESLEAIRATRTDLDQPNSPILISAVTGEGTDRLLENIELQIAGSDSAIEILLDITQLAQIPWVYENASVITRDDLEDGSVRLEIRASSNVREKLSRFIVKA